MAGILKQINRSNGGLPKRPVADPVMLNAEGVEADWQRNRKYHGGPEKAVLMISADLIDALIERAFPIFYGALGENLTVAGLDPHLWRAGQRYSIGETAEIELTTLRVPCLHLNVYGPQIKRELYDARCKAGDITAEHWAYGGFYARVTRPGLISPGAPVILISDVA